MCTPPPPAQKEAQSRCYLAPSNSKQSVTGLVFIVTGRKLSLVLSGKGGRLPHFAFWKMSRLKSSRRRISHLQEATRIKRKKKCLRGLKETSGFKGESELVGGECWGSKRSWFWRTHHGTSWVQTQQHRNNFDKAFRFLSTRQMKGSYFPLLIQ